VNSKFKSTQKKRNHNLKKSAKDANAGKMQRKIFMTFFIKKNIKNNQIRHWNIQICRNELM